MVSLIGTLIQCSNADFGGLILRDPFGGDSTSARTACLQADTTGGKLSNHEQNSQRSHWPLALQRWSTNHAKTHKQK